MNASIVRQPESALLAVIYVTYALYAVGLAIAPFAVTTRVGDYLVGWPPLIAVIVNYAKQARARGTWLESHFRWQIRTVWLALAWVVLVAIAALASGPASYMLVWRSGVYVLGAWALYRLARGVLCLLRRRAVPS